jgi:hypothetical protein
VAGVTFKLFLFEHAKALHPQWRAQGLPSVAGLWAGQCAGASATVHMIALSLEEFVVAVRPPYEPAATGPPESATIELNRPEVPVSYEVSRTVTPDGAVHADTAVDLSVHHDTTQSPAAADTVAVV